jgi:integrase
VQNLQDVPYPGLRLNRAQSDGYAEKGTKTRKSRVVPLTSRANDIARSHAGEHNPGEYLFVTATGKQLRGNGFRRTLKWSSTSFGHTIHDLRHYAASSWLRAGLPVHQVAKWLGHQNPATLLRIYAHVLGERQEIAALKHLDGLGAVRPEFAPKFTDANLRAALVDDTNDEKSM